jgi:chromosome segregation ATPase
MTKTEKIRDRFLQAFEEDTDFRSILEEYQGSKSVLYKGMAMAFKHNLQDCHELQAEAASIRKEVCDFKEKKKGLQKEAENLEEELETQRLKKAQLRAEIKTLKKKRAEVKAELETLREKVIKQVIETVQDFLFSGNFKIQESSQKFDESLEAKKKDINEWINTTLASSMNTRELRLARLLSPGQLASQEDIRNISPKEMSNFIHSVRIWANSVLPDEKIIADDTLVKEAVFVNTYYMHSFDNVLAWIERKLTSWQKPRVIPS